jgi:MFS family permease
MPSGVRRLFSRDHWQMARGAQDQVARWTWSVYRGALASRGFRRLAVGDAVSGLGDGLGFVAVAWLATELAAPALRPYAVGLAVAAYSLPGALPGLLARRRWLSRAPRTLMAVDAAVRMTLIGLVPLFWVAGLLTLWPYVGLLAGSSLLHTFGRGGFVGLVAEQVPHEHRFAANSLLQSSSLLALTVLGPGLGGVLIAVIGAPAVLAIDASTFGVLLVALATVPPALGRAGPANQEGPGTAGTPPVVRSGVRLLLGQPLLTWLLALTVGFYGLYGPVETALPIFVRHDLHRGSSLYGLIWAAFGVGAVLGALAAGGRRISNLRWFAVAVVAGWGLSLLLAASTHQPAVVLAGMALGGLAYAPYPAAATTLLQENLTHEELVAAAAAWTTFTLMAAPVGSLVGGPIIAAIGAQATLVASAVSTVVLAAVVAMIMRLRLTARD